MTFTIKNGEIFKFRGPIGNPHDKWEMPFHKINRSTVLKVGSKNPERDQGSEQVFDPLITLGEVYAILFII
jgi:hypothetical protein